MRDRGPQPGQVLGDRRPLGRVLYTALQIWGRGSGKRLELSEGLGMGLTHTNEKSKEEIKRLGLP